MIAFLLICKSILGILGLFLGISQLQLFKEKKNHLALWEMYFMVNVHFEAAWIFISKRSSAVLLLAGPIKQHSSLEALSLTDVPEVISVHRLLEG